MNLEERLPAGRERIVVYAAPLAVYLLWELALGVLAVLRAVSVTSLRVPWGLVVPLLAVAFVAALSVARALEARREATGGLVHGN